MTATARRTAPATARRFTAVTWEGLNFQYGRNLTTAGSSVLNWEHQHDLAVDLWNIVQGCGLDYETAASAVEAAGSGLPVHIVWSNPFGDGTEVHEGYAIIDHISYSANPHNVRLRLRYSGFSHDVYATQIRTITQVGITTRYEEQQ